MTRPSIRSLASLVLAAALSFAACGTPAAAEDTVDGRAAHALVAAGATLLDVRTPGEWASGHIDGAVLIPVSELRGRMGEIPRDRPVVVYCASGVRSAQATALLRAAGYDARDLGGMSRWDR